MIVTTSESFVIN